MTLRELNGSDVGPGRPTTGQDVETTTVERPATGSYPTLVGQGTSLLRTVAPGLAGRHTGPDE